MPWSIDRLVCARILDLVPPGAMRIYVGKAASAHHLSQDEINELLVRLARPGRVVVGSRAAIRSSSAAAARRRPIWRATACLSTVVPGITAAAGCAAAAGIPLTHRGLATGVRFVTGHCCAGAGLDLDWRSLADPETTLVVYMGLANLAEIASR